MTFTNGKKNPIAFDPSIHDIFTNDLALCTQTAKVARLRGSKDLVAWVTANPIKLESAPAETYEPLDTPTVNAINVQKAKLVIQQARTAYKRRSRRVA